MTRVEKTIEIGASPEDIWPYVTWDKIPEWFDMFKSAEWTSAEKNTVGSKVHVVTEVADEKNEFDAEITKFANTGEGARAWKSVRGRMKASGAVFVEPEPDRNKTLVTLVEEYKLPYGVIGRMKDRIELRRAFEENLANSSRRLKEITEAR